MPHDYVPRPDRAFSNWVSQLAEQVAVSPGAVGLTQQQSDELSAGAAEFAARLNAATDGATEGRATKLAKSESRARLEPMVRKLVGQLQANPTTTDAQRSAMRLTIAKKKYTRNVIPDKAPKAYVERVLGRQVTYRVFGGGASGRGRAKGAKSATLLTHIGDEPPTDSEQWRFGAISGKTFITIEYPPQVTPGTTVWMTATWTRPMGEEGHWSAPVKVMISEQTLRLGDGLRAAAA